MYMIENIANFLKCYHYNKESNNFVRFRTKIIYYTLSDLKNDAAGAF